MQSAVGWEGSGKALFPEKRQRELAAGPDLNADVLPGAGADLVWESSRRRGPESL